MAPPVREPGAGKTGEAFPNLVPWKAGLWDARASILTDGSPRIYPRQPPACPFAGRSWLVYFQCQKLFA